VDHIPGSGMISRISTHHLKMWVVPAEQFRCRVMSFGLHDRVAADVVLRVRNAYGIRALRFAQWSPALQNGCLVIIHPLHPRLHSLTALLRSGTFHHPFKVGPRSHIDREPPSTRRGNRIDGWFESLTHQIAVQLCKTLCCAPEQGTQGGLFQHMLRRSSAEEGNRAEATRASRFERLQY